MAKSRNTAHHTNKNLTVSVEEAQRIILESVRPLGYETIPIIEAYNRILYENIVSDMMIPPVDDSAMDGYAIIAGDTFGASRIKPVRLRIIGEIQAGASPAGESARVLRFQCRLPMRSCRPVMPQC